MRTPFSSRLAFGALVVALSVTVACGGDDSSDDGDGGASGEGNSAGRGGSSGRGGTSGGGNEAGEGSGGSMSSAKGTFDSVWKQSQAEVTTFSLTGGGVPTEATVNLPALYPVPDTDSEVEMYQAFRDGMLFTYAHVVDTPSYYLVKSPVTAVDDGYYLSLGLISGLYTLEDGVLTFSTQFSTSTAVGMSTSRFEPYTGDFPPPDWPSEMVELDLSTEGAP
jgi:hypothetical protein